MMNRVSLYVDRIRSVKLAMSFLLMFVVQWALRVVLIDSGVIQHPASEWINFVFTFALTVAVWAMTKWSYVLANDYRAWRLRRRLVRQRWDDFARFVADQERQRSVDKSGNIE